MKLLFIDIDTLRPDHMGCYGYNRNTTPNIDSVCQDSIKFNQYYCSDAPCLPSRASLITGNFGIKNGVVGHGGTAGDKVLTGKTRGFRDISDSHNFNNIFRRAGMYTASISTFPERHSAWWFNAGFNECYNIGDCGLESGEKIMPLALDWLTRNKNRNDWFLHIHLWDPHTPYRAPDSFGNPFENEPLNNWITEDVFKEHLNHTGPHCINELNMFDDYSNPKYPRMLGKASNMKDMKKVFDGYDCGICYTDYLLGQLFDLLKEQGIYDDTGIIITSDHGENMGEFGIYAEHGTADEATCHIPFIVKWPGCKKGTTDNGLHYSLDLLPTVAQLLKVDSFPEWDGKSFADTITDGKYCGRNSLVVSQMAHVCQRSARFDDWLYIRTYHDGFHLFDKEMLFNIKDDPHEQYDLKEKYPEICNKGAKIILDWHDKAMIESKSLVDPMLTVLNEGGPFHTLGFLDNYLKRLEETGRANGAKILREKYNK